MKTKKLKGFVLPTVYVMVIGVLFVSISYLGQLLQSNVEYSNMAVSALKENITPVIKNEDVSNKSILKPFASEKVSVSKSFYNMQDDEAKQQNSLVYYEKTYLQNSGILYTSEEVFDVINTFDGTVTKVSKDEILGNYVEITHNTDLKTVYYSLSEINVKVDDEVKAGTIIGKSGDNMLENETDNCLLFEVYQSGNAIDPEKYYSMSLDDLG